MTFIILSLIILIISIIFFYKANQIRIAKNQQQEKYKISLQENIKKLQKQKNDALEQEIRKKNQINEALTKQYNNKQKEINEHLEKEKQLAYQELEKTNDFVQKEIDKVNKEIEDFKITSQQKKKEIQSELDKLKASLNAGVEARLRQQEKKDKIDFYRLIVQDADFEDIQKLQNLKSSFHKPVVLSKLIWTQYFQKQMTELCDRVLGKNIVCGIYKITNILTEQCYIGQSVDIAKRWKDHCKCGLGIEASSTNKLYQSMQKDGVWNFTFELLEECPKELLNEKEKFWIQMYQSNNFGYNITKGVMK